MRQNASVKAPAKAAKSDDFPLLGISSPPNFIEFQGLGPLDDLVILKNDP